MSKQERKDKTPVKRVRFSIIDDDSHKELFCFSTGKGNAIFAAAAVLLLVMGVTYCLFAFTGLRHAIPGYPSNETKMMAVQNAERIDSLERAINVWAFQVENIQRIATGRAPLTIDSVAVSGNTGEIGEEERLILAQSDSILRDQVKQNQLSETSAEKIRRSQMKGLHFYPPLKGIVTKGFNRLENHPFVDISAPENTSVCAVLDGTVIASEWNDRSGYTIQIQHPDDMISIYRHNEKLLKNVGDKVTAGTPVAVVGNTGELSTGAHLQFELWHKGEAVDPSRYITL